MGNDANKGQWKARLVTTPPPKLSRRDYFAAAALAGLCTDDSVQEPAQVAADLADRLIAALDGTDDDT